MSALRHIVRKFKPDLVHAWDWFQGLEAFYSTHLPLGVPLLISDMFMSVARVLPKSLPTTFGTPGLVDQARECGHSRAQLLLPPVDVEANALELTDASDFQRRNGLSRDEVTLVIVSRLDLSMKFEGIARSIRAVEALGASIPLKLVIVGDGSARSHLEALAAEANAKLDRLAVVFTGELTDPRPAYACADIVIGMGGSALRALSFRKPLIVVGERGFSARFDEGTCKDFLYSGFYGLGSGNSSTDPLVAQIAELASSPERLISLGAFGRSFVVEHFSLASLGSRLSELCTDAASRPPSPHAARLDGIRSAAIYVRERLFLRRGVDLKFSGLPYVDPKTVADTLEGKLYAPGAP